MNERLTLRRMRGVRAASSPVKRIPGYATQVVIGVKTFSRHEIVLGKGLNGVGGLVWARGLRRPGVFTPPSGLVGVKVDYGPIIPATRDR